MHGRDVLCGWISMGIGWCPKRSGWPSHSELLVIGTHPGQSPHHRLGERLQGKGLLQIWAIDLMPGKINIDNFLPSRGKAKTRGRGRGRAAAQEINSPLSDEEEWNTPVDTYTKSTGFNLKKGAREKARGRKRGRGRGRKVENERPESPPETLNAWIASRAATEETPSKSSSGVLPKMVLAIAHEGEVAWDAKWRPVADAGEGLDERECMRLGFLAVVLEDGSVQVFDVPLPTMWEVNGAQQVESEALVIQMNPIFRNTDLQTSHSPWNGQLWLHIICYLSAVMMGLWRSSEFFHTLRLFEKVGRSFSLQPIL